MLRLLLICCLATAILTLPTLSAQADDAAQARFHDKRARALYRKARFKDALREFFIVRRLAPQAQTSFNIALCFDQLAQRDQAFYYFSQFVEQAPKGDKRRSFAQAALTRLRPSVARLLVESDPPGADVYVDRIEHGSWGVTPITVPLTKGKHRVWVAKAGHRRATRTVVTRLGRQVNVRLTLTPVVGHVKITSAPKAALILSNPNGEELRRGTTPFEDQVTPGVYVAELDAPGHRPERVVVDIIEDERTTRHIELESLPSPKGEITITSNIPDALIEVDGEPTGFSPALLSDVDIGLRKVRISADGTMAWEGDVEIEAQGRGYLTATLQPPPRVERSATTWVAGGVGLASIVAGIITGVVALNASNEFERLVTNPNGANLTQLKDQGETFAAVSNGLYISGGIALTAAAILFFTTAEETDPSSAQLAWEKQ